MKQWHMKMVIQFIDDAKKSMDKNANSRWRINTCGSQLFPPTPKYFVFTHQDIAPRNLFLDGHQPLAHRLGALRLVSHILRVCRYAKSQLSLISLGNKLRWWLFCLVSVGIYREESQTLTVVRGKCITYPLARKDIVLEEGAHFDTFHLRKHGI